MISLLEIGNYIIIKFFTDEYDLIKKKLLK
jgi:hypothetical protein